jgi:hypothetical protein
MVQTGCVQDEINQTDGIFWAFHLESAQSFGSQKGLLTFTQTAPSQTALPADKCTSLLSTSVSDSLRQCHRCRSAQSKSSHLKGVVSLALESSASLESRVELLCPDGTTCYLMRSTLSGTTRLMFV